MTDFEHADISRRLALAIGWPEHKLYSEGDGSFVSINVSDMGPIKRWRDFDYRDTAVIWPVAERFDAFPATDASGIGGWNCITNDELNNFGEFVSADTAALAVALAVIKAREQS